MDNILWPARNVAEYAYCPRLFYLMQVEGLHIPNTDTEAGKAVHRRVDRPSAVLNDDDCPRVVRSLVLTSEARALTATLDLAELAGDVAVPVEYRKGRPSRVDGKEGAEHWEAWPADRIQLALQALLLEEAGYRVVEGILYYAGIKKRLSICIDETLKFEALATLESAKKTAQGERPLPLVDDARCPKCSLQPLCLPDEVNQQRAEARGEDYAPRKIWPPRDDGIHVVAQQDGYKIGISGGELKVSGRDGKCTKSLPLTNIESLSVVGFVQVSTQALHKLAEMKIPLAFLSAAGRLVAMVDPLDSVSAAVRRAQVRKFDQENARLTLSAALISAKILNQRTLLMRNHKALPEDLASSMLREAQHALRAESLEVLRGHEGQAAALYFKHFGGMLNPPFSAQFDVNGRKRRPPPDPVNACLSFAYTMLCHECVAALRLARLEPSIGALHVSRPGRPALALDLMEAFRSLISDSVVLTCFNRGELAEGHFMRSASGYIMTDAGRSAFFNALGRRMNTDITHPVFDYRLSYRRMIVLHARMIAAWLLDEIPTLSFLTTR